MNEADKYVQESSLIKYFFVQKYLTSYSKDGSIGLRNTDNKAVLFFGKKEKRFT
jgi:hypothetical protein